MIGQKEVLSQINDLIERGFPRFVVITGQKGQGKTELAKYITNKLSEKIYGKPIPLCEFGIKIDEIREMIQMAYKQTEPIIYLIQNADKMSIGAKNSLLKVIEEPPQQAYFIMELQQIENTLDTIRSRCQQIKMEQYTDEELIEFLPENINQEDRTIIIDIASNKYQIDLLLKYKPKEFYNYVDKVVNNIYRVQSANSFKIAEKIDLKDTGEGYDLHLFFITFRVICFEKAQLLIDSPEDNHDFDSYINSCNITAKYMNKLSINGINKQMLVDQWILDIRKKWLK